MGADGAATAVADIAVPDAAKGPGYSGPRDLLWDSEHNELVAGGDNERIVHVNTGETKTEPAMIVTYTPTNGSFAITKLTATPGEIQKENTEGYAITTDASCVPNAAGRTGEINKPAFWSEDAPQQDIAFVRDTRCATKRWESKEMKGTTTTALPAQVRHGSHRCRRHAAVPGRWSCPRWRAGAGNRTESQTSQHACRLPWQELVAR